MQFKRPGPEQVYVGLAALKYLALSDDIALLPAERAMLAAVQRVFGTELDIDRIEALGPAEVRGRVRDPQIRRQIVCALVVFALIDGEATEQDARLIDAFAYALEVEEKAVRNLYQLARRQHMELRIDVLRRFWAIDKLRERVDDEGFGAVLRFVRANVGRLEDDSLARRFRTLGDLPDGTLGREYVRYLERNGWPLPGERGALSDIIVFHDLTHVLADYGTDPAGEVEVACFSAGYRREEPFTFVLFVLLQFHIGLRMTPGSQAERGYFDVERALRALERGAALRVDLSSGWNYWDVVGVQVDELRVRYGILPKRESPEALIA
jgi:hypothetical protein